jgi:beta-ketoacyl synthase-like protein
MRAVNIRGIGVCGAGLANWAATAPVLAGSAMYVAEAPSRRAFDALPPTERRRINETSRLACLAATDALQAFTPAAVQAMPTVFTSSDGDGAVLAHMLHSLAQPSIVMSPTAFHNSVYNAPAGYWSIAMRVNAPSTTLCAGDASFAAALLEAYAQAQAQREPVLVVAVDVPFPVEIRVLGLSAAAFACALVLQRANGGTPGARLSEFAISAGTSSPAGALAAAFDGNAAAAALPLLRALAIGETAQVTLPYVDGRALVLEVAP